MSVVEFIHGRCTCGASAPLFAVDGLRPLCAVCFSWHRDNVRLVEGRVYVTRSGKLVAALKAPVKRIDYWECSDGRWRLYTGIYATRYPSQDLVREWDHEEKLPWNRKKR